MNLLQNDWTFQNLFNKYQISRLMSFKNLLLTRSRRNPESVMEGYFRKTLRYAYVFRNIMLLLVWDCACFTK